MDESSHQKYFPAKLIFGKLIQNTPAVLINYTIYQISYYPKILNRYYFGNAVSKFKNGLTL